MGVEEKVPREAVEAVFGGVMAASPAIMRGMIGRLAATHGVEPDELTPWVGKVLSEMPPWED